MDTNFIYSSTLTAENEISKMIDCFSKQLKEKMENLFHESDEKWVDQVIRFAFRDDNLTNESVDDSLTKALSIAARQAKLLTYLKGLEIQNQLEKIKINQDKCLGRLAIQNLDKITPKILLQDEDP